MGVLLVAAAVLVAFVALVRLNPRLQVRRAMEEVFRRALPGARTGPREAVPDAVSPDEATSRFRWTEVVNLTAATISSRPRRAAERCEEGELTPVEHR